MPLIPEESKMSIVLLDMRLLFATQEPSGNVPVTPG